MSLGNLSRLSHAKSRSISPENFTIVDGVAGQDHHVGTYMAWGVNNAGWWGEGKIKVFMDGDAEFPTIWGAGTEDHFGGAYDFDPGVVERDRKSAYVEFTTPYAGLPQVIRPDGVYRSLQDDTASVAFWYQTLTTAPFPSLPGRDYLEVI